MNVESLVSEWDPLRGGLLPRARTQAGTIQQRWQVYYSAENHVASSWACTAALAGILLRRKPRGTIIAKVANDVAVFF